MAIKEEDLRLRFLVDGDNVRKEMREMAETIKGTKTEISALEKERRKLVRQYGEESQQVKALDQQLKTHKDNLKTQQDSYTEYQRKLSITGQTMKELSSHARYLSAALRNMEPGSAKFQEYSEELRKTKERLRELRTQTEGTGKAMSTLGGIKTGWLAVVGVVSRVAGALRGAVDTMKDFEQANVNLSTILGVTVDDMKDLTDEALRLGGSTRYTASEVTALQTELAKLGFGKEQIKAMEEPVLNFATAVGAELPEAASLAGAALRMFGLRSTDTEDTLAALALSTNKSALNFSFLQTALSTVGPVAKTFGFGIKDTTALLGALANSGFDASSAATATRNILLKLADANGDLARSLGGPVRNFDDLIAGLKTLNERGIDLSTTLELTDKRSVAAFNAFLDGADSAAALRDELDLTDGVLKDMAEKRMDTVEGAILRLQSAWEAFTLSLRNSQGFIKNAINLLGDLVVAITPKDKSAADLSNIAQRTEDYVAGYWRMYSAQEGGVDKIRTLIREDEEKMQKELKSAEAALARASGLAAKNRAKELIKYYREGLAVVKGAMDELENRISWSAGTYTPKEDSNSGGSSNSGGDSGKPKPHANKKQWSLASDEAYLKSKADIMKRYNEGEIASETEYEEALYQAELAAYQARLSLAKDKGADRAKIEADYQGVILKHTQDVRKRNEKAAADAQKKQEEERKKFLEAEKAALQVYISIAQTTEERKKEQIKAENLRYETEKAQYEKNKDTIKDYDKFMEALEKQHQQKLLKIRLDAIEAEKKDSDTAHKEQLAKIQEKYAYELNLATTSAYKKAKLQKEQAADIAAENLSYIQKQMDLLNRILTEEASTLSAEQKQQYEAQLAELKAKLAEAKATVENLSEKSQNLANLFKGGSGGSLFGVSQSDWDNLFLNIEKGTMTASDLSTMLSGMGGAAQEGFKLASQAIALTNAKEKAAYDDYVKQQDSKKDALSKRLKAGLMTQAQYDKEMEDMEKERAQKEADMKSEQAQRQKKMSVIEAIINTALGVTKTLASFGATPAGLVAAGIMAALGAAQVAMISAQPAGYAEGGLVTVQRSQDGKPFKAVVAPDKRGFISRPTVLVGEEGGEYVIPADGVKNPSFAPWLATIENARRMGTLKSLNLQAAYPAAPVGYASGGYTSQAMQSEAGEPSLSAISGADLSEIKSMLSEVLAKMDDPVPAVMSMTGPGGFEEVWNKRQGQRARGKIGK